MTDAALLARLRDVVGDRHCLTDAALRATYETDWTRRFSAATLPFPSVFEAVVSSEDGAVEVFTVLFSLYGAYLGLRLFLARKAMPAPTLGWWWLAFFVGLIVLAGEEASWGQHWLHFATPESLSGNLQGEANLHNLSKASEQIPKNTLSLAVLVGGVFWPLYVAWRKRPARLGGWFGWIWPDAALWPSAAIAFALRIADRIMVVLDMDDGPTRAHWFALKESIELYLVTFVVGYLGLVLLRTRAERAQ